MDELTFDPALKNTDTTQEIEGYDDHIEEVQKAYPEQDWRTPVEVEAEQQQSQEQPTTEAQPQDQINEVATQVADQVGQQLGIQPQSQPQPAPEQDPFAPPAPSPNRYQEDPNTGFVNVQEVLADGVDPKLAQMANVHLQYDDEERQVFGDFHDAGGDINLEATLNLVNSIRNSPRLTAKYDRNGDGYIGYSDWFDVSKMPEIITPEREMQLTQQWLASLQNKSFNARLGAIQTLTPMIPYMHQRRKGILGPEDELDGEQARASSLAGLTQATGDFLSGFEKVTAGFAQSDKALGKGDDWFNEDAFETKDAVLDDIILNHKNPQSLGYAVTNPINRVWSDPIMFELGRYSPSIAASFLYPGALTQIGLGGKGVTALGVATGVGTTARAFGVTWATETIPTNIFTDLNTNAMKTFHSTKESKAILDAHPEMNASGLQLAHGIESPWSRKLEFMRGEMAWDAGGLLAGNILFRSLGRFGKQIGRKNWEAIQTSTRAKPKIQTPDDMWKVRNQVFNDIEEAAIDQTKMAAEGPSSKWNESWAANGELDIPYGGYKNDTFVAGQGTGNIRKGVYDIGNQADEIRGQIGIEGGTVDEIFTNVERADFGKNGIPDPWFTNKTDEFWNDPTFADELSKLNPLQRKLGEWSKGTLESIKEIMGRDAGSLSPEEFWDGRIFNAKLEPGKKLDDVKKFVIKNLQVQDAVNQSLLKRLRDYADATGAQLGKGDIFAKDGAMRNIARNLAMGLTEVKKTQFTWDLATKRMKEAGGDLTPDMIKEIEQVVAQRTAKLTQETNDGVRLMMQVLENSDSDELAEGILDVFKVSNDIHNWKDFDAWMRQKITGGEFNGKVKTGVLIHELQGVMVNSILSGPKTPLRALLGTTTNSYLNAINEAAGATLRRPFTGDIASQRASIAKLKGMIEMIPEATEVFRKNMKASFNANIADIRTRYSEPLTRGDNNWHLFEQWTEKNGTMGDKAAFYMANIARNLNNNKLLSWSPRALAATDETFKWLLARARSKEIGMRQALEVAEDTHTAFSPDLMKQAEDIHYKNLLDADGNLDLKHDSWLEKQFKEVTLTSELTGFAKELDTLLRDKPLVRPFYLFARTGINGLNFTYKNTPLLGALHKESIDILRHTGDDYSSLFKYGIENADDLANARNLFAGRQAVGAATVTTFAGMYMAGQLTGNGPADRKLRQSWINSGWKPNHFYIGDVGFDYTTLEPYNTIFSAIADIGDNMELMGSEWSEKRLQAAAFVIGRGLTGKTYMSGLDQMLQVAQMKPGSLDKAGANILNNSIPLAGMRNEFGKWVNPHMKELNSDMWTSIRNRNQTSEFLAGDQLPIKYDMLNGRPIKNWNIIGRSFNAVSPVALDIRSKSPGRKLLLDSNYDLKSTVYSYGGYSFVKSPKVRSEFQREIGSVPIEVGFKKFKNVEEALNHLATRDDVKESMAKMQADGKNPANWDVDPNNYPHNTLIDNIMNQARAKAYARLNQPNHPGNAALEEVKADKDGLDSKTRKTREDIINLSFPNKQVDQFPKN